MLYEKLYPHQKDAVEFALKVKTAAIFAKQRTGKTWITMAMAEQLLSLNYEGLYVVPLNNLETTWVKNLSKELPLAHVTTEWNEFKKLQQPKILLIHYEILHKLIKKILRHRTWLHIVFDESQRLKGRGTRQSRMARKLRNSAEYKLILSGTPIEKSPEDVWAQFRFLNPEILGDRWSDFDAEYLKPTGYMGYKRKFIQSKMTKFLSLIAPYSIRIEKDVLKMPDRKVNEIRVPMFGKQERYYRSMEDKSVLYHNGRRLMADMTLTQRIRLQQICGGFLSFDHPTDEKAPPEIVPVGSAKLRKLVRLVKHMNPPLVVFCKYVPELFMVYNELKTIFRRVELYYGKTPKEDRPGIQRRFQKGRIDCLICQNRTGGLGIDLYRTSTAIIFSLTFSYIDFDQLISRFDLYQKKEPVKLFILMAKNSIDEDIYQLVLNKENVSERALKQLRKKRRDTMAKNITVTSKKKGKPAGTSKAAGKIKDKASEKAAPTPEEFKFTVATLAEDLGIKEASARIKLRKAEVPKNGRAYGWNSKAEYEKVLKQLKPSKE